MSVKLFLSFVSKFKNVEYGSADLSSLSAEASILSPATLPVSDLEDSMRRLPDIIVSNFLQNYGQSKFPLNGLRTLANILQFQDVDARVRQILLVHLTKLELSVSESIHYYVNIKTLASQPSPENLLWLELASATIMHPQINLIIDSLIQKHFEIVTSSNMGPTTAKFVSMDAESIRGFSGFNEVYINQNHFIKKFGDKMMLPKIKEISQIDVITVTLHELADVRLRQKLNDFNLSTPNKMKNIENHKKEDLEFGRMLEIEIFKGQVDWFTSIEAIADMKYVNEFISSIQKGTDIPTFDSNIELTYRIASVKSGVDMHCYKYIC